MSENSIRDCEVMLLAAGFGTRLRPLTDSIPKPLINLGGKTLIEYNLELIKNAGFKKVLINLHYLGEKIVDYLGDGSKWGINIVYLPEKIILDTGGGIKNSEKYLEPETKYLFTINSDLLLSNNFPFLQIFQSHLTQKKSLATLVLRGGEDYANFGELGIDEEGFVTYFLTREYGSNTSTKGLIYTGIQLLTIREVFEKMKVLLPKSEIFSITRDFYENHLLTGGQLNSYIYQNYWNDVGTFERLEKAKDDAKSLFGS